MKVLRVTDSRGHGFYTSGAARKSGLSISSGPTRPFPDEDGIMGVEDYHRFGFKSEAQIRAWFDEEVIYLRYAERAQVRVYEVPDEHVVEGRSQLIFNRNHAKLISIKKPKEIL